MQIGENLENKDDLVSGDFTTRLIIQTQEKDQLSIGNQIQI